MFCAISPNAPGQLATKEAILDAVWPEAVVGDAVLKVCVREIRKALGDASRASRFVGTVHCLGYRFVAGVGESHSRRVRRPLAARCAQRQPPTPTGLRPERPLLVGREQTLSQLRQQLATARRGERRMVCITGEAGIGKTAVVEAFLDCAVADARVRIAYGHCVERCESNEPYSAMLDALARLCREDGADRLVSLLRRRAPTWLAQMPWLLEADQREPVARDASAKCLEKMAVELADAVAALAADTLFILVVEDLQWADPWTIDLLALLAQRLEPARLLMIGTYRPTELAARRFGPALLRLRKESRCHELSLGPLDESAIGEYFGARFGPGAFSTELVAALHRPTHGNPLLLARAVDELVARAMIVRSAGHWELRAEIDEIAAGLPEGLYQFLARTRLPRPQQPVTLNPQARGGSTFPWPAISRLPADWRARTAEA